MPRNRPPTSGYARIAQAEEEEEESPYSDDDDHDPFADGATLSVPGTEYAPMQPNRRSERMHKPSASIPSPRRPRRPRTNSGVDIKAINARLERWAEEIKERFKIRRVRGKSAEDEHLEIYSSVFQAPDWIRPATKETLDQDYDDGLERMSKLEFDDLVESVRTAIELGMHPTLISQGSSGSYFARNSGGKVVGVFKPKDEEPYANKNPKWTKWVHRNLFPFAFGRAMLIPNLSYVSEAAAYVLDCQLRTNLVPYTDVVALSSKSFHYDYWERRAFYRKRKPLPEKLGSFQIFLKGYKGATEFFREHPWPDRQTNFRMTPAKSKKRRWADNCRPGSAPVEEIETDDEEVAGPDGSRSRSRQEFWSEPLQQSFREELEKLVILDYVMRNTDRGTDNWMIRIDLEKQEAHLVVEPPQDDGDADGYKRRRDNMSASAAGSGEKATPRIGAIDNSLSWPWKHPDAWRSYPFGWLFLPVSLIGRPFSERARNHFLPLLTSKEWWRDTQIKLRACFEIDADFKERMFARQMAVMKGQAWNVVEALKTTDHGPLELTRRSRVLVWDDIVEIPVAVPLQRPSEEMRRRITAEAQQIRQPARPNAGIQEEEEMDISAAHASMPTMSHDLLGFSSPTQDQAENPFNISRQSSSQDVKRLSLEPSTPPKEVSSPTDVRSAVRPGHFRSRTGGGRLSYDVPRAARQSPREHKRRFSLAARRTHGPDDGEDGDGDLGYVAASDQEGMRRKVIVERLEMVKGRQPFFQWC
ncbi:Phosphatidylinositol 3- and 4-kinase [Teratosphaeria destructans]|uniref:Phosphatidylinositol 4-kinase n=1 Tax=Teratosphaeria destructans TaxID=418781 RepID=A0A9W7VYF0_9PEZI|nr:Phosphatidylinositol 3- and 4-kinase [Teratosphaeria destructans]